MIFYLGTHETSWLRRLDVPLFVSRRRLAKRKTLPRALAPWALDSGGFTELKLFGGWSITPGQYAEEVQMYADKVGQLEWAPVQDWMCEPFVVEKTGRSVREHQELTTQSYLDLCGLLPGFPWVPVLQGWAMEDYWRHVDLYRSAGVQLEALPLVGLGSVCRRQHTKEVEALIWELSQEGIRLHGFGFKFRGAVASSPWLASADSLAWSYNARRHDPLPGCTHGSCANCPRWALVWRERLLRLTERRCIRPRQPGFVW